MHAHRCSVYDQHKWFQSDFLAAIESGTLHKMGSNRSDNTGLSQQKIINFSHQNLLSLITRLSRLKWRNVLSFRMVRICKLLTAMLMEALKILHDDNFCQQFSLEKHEHRSSMGRTIKH